MKKLSLLVISFLIICSCDDKLDLTPASNVNANGFYETADDIESAVAGAYDALQTYGQYGIALLYVSEVRSDNAEEEVRSFFAGEVNDIDLFSVNASNRQIQSIWQDGYLGIQRCNIVLNRIDGVDMNAQVRTTRIAEVKFLRALMYFNLVRIFGDLPLVLEEFSDPFQAFDFERSAVSLVYDQIIDDLTSAASALPTTPEVQGRATSIAANALLGKVYLTLGRFGDAATALRSANTGTHSLVANYADIFGSANEGNAELIFEVQHRAGNGEGSQVPNRVTPSTLGSQLLNGVGLPDGNSMPTQDLINSYEAGDARFNVSIGEINGAFYPKKLIEAPTLPDEADINTIVLRYADVVLMLAEVLNEQGYAANGEAFALLNSVRNRAGLPSLTATDLPDQSSFRVAIQTERRHEFAFEGQRWFDLIRTGTALNIMNAHSGNSGAISVAGHQLLYPVPQSEIDASGGKITQNPGF